MSFNPDLLLAQLISWVFMAVWVVVVLLLVIVLGYFAFIFFKHRNREDYALDFVNLMIRLPRDNEIKIDAAEQMFAALYSTKKRGWFSWLKPEHTLSFEIIALKEDIIFHVALP